LRLYYLEAMKEIRKIPGIGESRASQIRAAALVHLRPRLLLFRPRCEDSANPAKVDDVSPTSND
jgi:hypothetical protein